MTASTPRPSRSFDRAAGYYDATRDLPDAIATAGIDTLLHFAQVRPDARLLEAGTGTGRIAIPLLQRGANLVGCDLSLAMLLRQQAKHPGARLVQADTVHLPFPAGHFDAVITVHVLHLVGEWRAAVREFRRVLRQPGGVYINSWHWRAPNSMEQRLRDYWRSRVEAHGAAWRRPGAQSREEIVAGLQELGAAVEEVPVVTFQTALSAEAVINGIASRVLSDTWEVPDEVFATTVRELRAFAKQEYGDLARVHLEEQRFNLDVARF